MNVVIVYVDIFLVLVGNSEFSEIYVIVLVCSFWNVLLMICDLMLVMVGLNDMDCMCFFLDCVGLGFNDEI